MSHTIHTPVIQSFKNKHNIFTHYSDKRKNFRKLTIIYNLMEFINLLFVKQNLIIILHVLLFVLKMRLYIMVNSR